MVLSQSFIFHFISLLKTWPLTSWKLLVKSVWGSKGECWGLRWGAWLLRTMWELFVAPLYQQTSYNCAQLWCWKLSWCLQPRQTPARSPALAGFILMMTMEIKVTHHVTNNMVTWCWWYIQIYCWNYSKIHVLVIVWSTLISKGQSNPITCCADIKILDCKDSECDLGDFLFCCFCVSNRRLFF